MAVLKQNKNKTPLYYEVNPTLLYVCILFSYCLLSAGSVIVCSSMCDILLCDMQSFFSFWIAYFCFLFEVLFPLLTVLFFDTSVASGLLVSPWPIYS